MQTTKKNVYVILAFIFFLIIFPFIINIYKGLKFKKTKEKVHFINVPLVSKNQIKKLINTILKHGIVLDPSHNYNNSKGRKLTCEKIPSELKKQFMNDILLQKSSDTVGLKLNFAPNEEKYRIFARLYQDEDDWLNFHYDNNFTKGLRYTVVIPLYYSSKNTCNFVIKDNNFHDKIVNIPIGKAVIYNGSEIYHKISKQTKNQKRLVLILPLYTNYDQNIFHKLRMKARSIIYKVLKL